LPLHLPHASSTVLSGGSLHPQTPFSGDPVPVLDQYFRLSPIIPFLPCSFYLSERHH
jgi:hypothetical protein